MSEQMTPLRQRMIDDMTIRNMSPTTQKIYVRAVANFSIFHGRSPDKLTFEDVRDYRLHLISREAQSHLDQPDHGRAAILLRHDPRAEARIRTDSLCPQGRHIASRAGAGRGRTFLEGGA